MTGMFKREITFGQLLAVGVTVVGAILGFWINTNVRLSALEINKSTQDNNFIETKAAFRDINNKLDKINDGQNEIKVTLQNKQDRK